jgi:hypothetical protein
MCQNWPGCKVGNGGFALVTKRLIDFCYDEKFKIFNDMQISQTYRGECEARGGFKWAPEDVARDFSYEGWTSRGPIIPTARPRSFGYHCVTNWPAILTRDDLIARASLLGASAPGRNKVGLLMRAAPWLRLSPSPQLQNNRITVDRIRAERATIFQKQIYQRGKA